MRQVGIGADLNRALAELLESDERVILLGEDICDPYGGAFKVTKGLSTKYPGRVLNTPISEAAIVGMGNGLALAGKRPIVEIMFGDFLTLAADQIVNGAAKFRYMYNDQVSVPLVIRTPTGGYRGYGPTHSQCLESMFFHVPGLTIMACSEFHDNAELLKQAVALDEPVLFIEHKMLYPRRAGRIPRTADADVDLVLSNGGSLFRFGRRFPLLSVVAYGYAATLAADAITPLSHVELIVPSTIKPLPELMPRGRSVITVEEGPGGFGEMVAARYSRWGHNITCIHGSDSPVPTAKHLEAEVLPTVEHIRQVVECCQIPTL